MSNRSRLYEHELRSGASFVVHRGWETPQKFSSLADEYAVLKGGTGLLDLSSCGIIELSGADRARFLHGMVTNDIKVLRPGTGCYAALLTPQGRTLADLRVLCLEESFLLVVEADLPEKIVAILRKYIISDRVELLDRSQELALLSVQGPKSSELLVHLVSGPSAPDQPFSHKTVKIGEWTVRVCRVDRTGAGGYDILVDQRDLVEFWIGLLQEQKAVGIQPAGLEALNVDRIEAGIPWYGFDFDESNILLETGLDSAISLTKGCYIGQETIARATYVGQVNRRLVGLLLGGDKPASARDPIFKDQKEVGWITSCIISLALQRPVALGYLRREFTEPGIAVEVRHGDDLIKGTVIPLPFVKKD